MANIEGSNECFNCGEVVKWKANILEGRRMGVSRAIEITTEIAQVSFIGQKEIEVIIKCGKCYNINKFKSII